MSKWKDFHDVPALVIMASISVIVFSLLGYMALKTYIGPDITKSPETEKKAADTVNDKADSLTNPNLKATLDGSKVKIESDGMSKDFVIWNDNTKVGEIKEEVASAVKFFKRVGNGVYLGVDKEGSMKTELFDGPQEVYRVNLENNAFDKVFAGETFASDVSPDGSQLVAVERFYIGDAIYNYVNIYDIGSHQSKSFQVSAGHDAAGNAYFSNDRTKVVYEASVDEKNKKTVAMFAIDLASGTETEIAGKGSYDKAKIWAEAN